MQFTARALRRNPNWSKSDGTGPAGLARAHGSTRSAVTAVTAVVLCWDLLLRIVLSREQALLGLHACNRHGPPPRRLRTLASISCSVTSPITATSAAIAGAVIGPSSASSSALVALCNAALVALYSDATSDLLRTALVGSDGTRLDGVARALGSWSPASSRRCIQVPWKRVDIVNRGFADDEWHILFLRGTVQRGRSTSQARRQWPEVSRS